MLSRIYVREHGVYLIYEPGLHDMCNMRRWNVQDGWMLRFQQHGMCDVCEPLCNRKYVRDDGVYLGDEPGLHVVCCVRRGNVQVGRVLGNQ